MVVSDRRFERIYDFRETSGETQAQDRFRGHRIKPWGGGARRPNRSAGLSRTNTVELRLDIERTPWDLARRLAVDR